jgi:hypothetical protein
MPANSVTYTYSVVGIDPTTGAQKFNVLGTSCLPDAECMSYPIIIAGDSYAYFAYEWSEFPTEYLYPFIRHLMVLRIDSSGNYENIHVWDYTSDDIDLLDLGVSMITNADQGVLLTWSGGAGGMAVTAGSSVGLVSAPQVPGGDQVVPVLQAQDGSFVGTTCPGCAAGDGTMVAFDASGNVRWTVSGDTPYIATADGGVIGQSGTTYDQNGNVTGQGALPGQYSWTGSWYGVSGDPTTVAIAFPFINLADSFTAFVGGNASGNGTANKPATKTVQQLIAQTALSYVGSQNWNEASGDLQCNIFVQHVLLSAGAQAPVSSSLRSWTKYELGLSSSPYYPALASDWAKPSTDLKCWHNVPALTNTLGPDYPAEHAVPGDVIAEAINYRDASGHVGVVAGPQQTVSADSASWCFPPYSPAGTIDISNFGFRPDSWLDPYTNPTTGQPCRTTGLMSNAVVKRFVCQ